MAARPDQPLIHGDKTVKSKSIWSLVGISMVLVLTLATGTAQSEEVLQIIQLDGRLIAEDGHPLYCFDYLSSGQTYHLAAESSVELATIEGRQSYLVQSPGRLIVDKSGRVKFNDQTLTPRKLTGRLASAKISQSMATDLGATSMRDQSGVTILIKNDQGETEPVRFYSGYHALVIGCGDYQAGWPKLPNPVNDAREVGRTLANLGWEVEVLTDPDWSRLREAMNRLVTGPGRDPDRAIMVWFSGHGHTATEADGGRLGYIVPVDAPLPQKDEAGFMDKAFNMRQIETLAKRIKSRHVIMLFDSCFSGAIFSMVRAAPSAFIQEKLSRPVRQFITAGRENEKVPDRSFFKTVFIQAVAEGEADRNHDGYVTGEELGAYLQERVVNYTRKAQHPQYGKINNPKLDKGDFIICLVPIKNPPPRPVKPQQTHKPVSQALHAKAEGGYKKPPSATRMLKGKKCPYELWYNPILWQTKPTSKPAQEFRLVHRTNEAYAVVIAERVPLDSANLKRAVTINLKKAGAQILDTGPLEELVVNGTDLWCWTFTLHMMGGDWAFRNYYWLSSTGVIQLNTYTATHLMDEHRADLNDLLNGLVIKAD